MPDVAAQRAAMEKLSFLVGKWSGEASVLHGRDQFVDLLQTEEAHFMLDGLVLMIEGIGRHKLDGQLVLQALGLISFDDETGKYTMRAFNDGRWLKSEVQLSGRDGELTWGFTLGGIKTHTVMRINEQGEWTESAELTIADRAPQKLMDLNVRRVSEASSAD